MKSIKVLTSHVVGVAVVLISVLAAPGLLFAQSSGFCTQTAKLLFSACGAQAQDDFLVARAICVNESEQSDRAQCNADAQASRDESKQLCQEQLDGRLDACQSLGENRYDPEFEPALFDNPKNPTKPNPLLPVEGWLHMGLCRRK